ncbi:hypothetical protein QIS74_02270 [Colletotrichum tabaci]|uniref:Uncharacterized protein n=1 Tax=Colletotrichum tabaci TaxID=1209068 RepID=A0AAV9TRH1_9PEZI
MWLSTAPWQSPAKSGLSCAKHYEYGFRAPADGFLTRQDPSNMQPSRSTISSKKPR